MAQQDPLEVLCVKFEVNRTSTRYAPETKCSWTAQHRNIIQSPLRPSVLNSDLKYFKLSIHHLEVTHIPKIVILAYSYKVIGKRRGKKSGWRRNP